MLDVKVLKFKAVNIYSRAIDWFAVRAMQEIKDASDIIKIKEENTIIINKMQ